MNFWISDDLVHLSILVPVGISEFLFGKHKLFVASRRRLSHLKYKLFVLINDKEGYCWYLGQPISSCANLHRNNHRITSMLCRKLCNWNTFWNMNNIFTVTSQITLTLFRAQGPQEEPESKGIIYSFGYKGVYLRENLGVWLLWVCKVIIL